MKKMSNWEQYLREHPETLEVPDLPAGHEERFAARLDAALSEAGRNPAGQAVKERKSVRWISFPRVVGLTLATASLAALFVLLRPARPAAQDWFAGVGDDQVQIYEVFSGQVAQIYDELYARVPDDGLGLSAASIVEEAVPLIDQLPEEMDPSERAAVLKEYYGTLLDGLLSVREAVPDRRSYR